MATWKRVITTNDDSAYKNSNTTKTDVGLNLVPNSNIAYSSAISEGNSGLVPADPLDTTKFLRSDGTWVLPDYTSSQLSSEEVQDIVGAMFSNNTETNITVTYEDVDGTIDLVSTDTTYSIGDGGLTTNDFTNVDHSKLDGIEASADVTDATNVTAAGALMDSELTSIADVKALNQSVVSGATPTFTTTNFTDATNKRFMTDAQETILDSVETNADVTDTTNVTAAGALMDSELTAIASVKALDQGVATGDSPTFAGLTVTGEFVASAGSVTLEGAVEIEDDFIVLNSDYASAAAVDAGLTVEMGSTLNNVSLYQDASEDHWKMGFQSGDLQIASVENGAVTTTVAAAASEANGIGSIFVDTTNTELYIYF